MDEISEEESHDTEPIALPGYHRPTPAKYHGPSFPPQAPALVPVGSSELAVNIAAKDRIQHTAMEWYEVKKYSIFLNFERLK